MAQPDSQSAMGNPLPPKLAVLYTQTGEHLLKLKLANSFLTRFRGLMLSKPLKANQGMLITRCPSVHTAFMLYPIDVVYLSSIGFVTKCMPNLKPWRSSTSWGKDALGTRYPKASHVLELPAGNIARLNIRPGDWLEYCLWRMPEPAAETAPLLPAWPSPMVASPAKDNVPRLVPNKQRGSAMIEFVVVGPVVTLLGLAVLQYGMLFFAKNQINHASFMAARAGSMGNANLSTVANAYTKALIPLYGGGRNQAELTEAYGKAVADVAGNTRIELLNPTKESFDSWNDVTLQNSIGHGKKVIPNSGLVFKNPNELKAGQSIQDANIIKLRITHGYEPKVPLIKLIYTKYLQWLDPNTDNFHSQLVNAGRIPVVTNVTLQMQSDAIQSDNPVFLPAMGNSGNTTNPAGLPTSPPNCLTIACTVPNTPVDPGGTGGGTGGGGGTEGGAGTGGGAGSCTGGNCPVCGTA